MRTTGAAKASRGGQANGRHGLDASAIQNVREICRDSPDEDIQAALLEHNGDVQAAVVSLLENPFRHVEKKKKKTQKPVDRDDRHSNREYLYRDGDRRGSDRNRGRGRGGDRAFDSDAPSRGRGRGGRGRGRGPQREPEPVQPSTDETASPPPVDFGTRPTDFSPVPEDVTTPSPPRVVEPPQQPQSRPAAHAVVSPSISWASKVKKGPLGAPVTAKQDAMPEYEQEPDHLEPEPEPEPIANGVAEESTPAESTPPMRGPAGDDFGSGFGHDTAATAWDSTQPQTSAWSTAAVASPEVAPQEQLPEQPQHPTYPDAPPGIPTTQPFADSKPFDLRDLGGALPASGVVDDGKAQNIFEVPQDPPAKPPGFGPPGLQQGSPLTNIFVGRNVSGNDGNGSSSAADPPSFMGSSFGAQFGQGVPPVADPAGQHQGQHPAAGQQPASHHAPAAPQPARQQEVAMSPQQPPQQQPQQQQAQQAQRGQQDGSTGQGTQMQSEAHAQQSFDSQFHSSHHPRSPGGKGGAAGMFMGESLADERMPEHSRSQSQSGPQGGQPGEKQRGAAEGKDQAPEHPTPQMHAQAYQPLPQEHSTWSMPTMQHEMYLSQRPGAAQMPGPAAMQGIVPGMAQMPAQMPGQYAMTPSMGGPGYGYGGPAQNYAQMGYGTPPYMQPHSYAPNMPFNQYQYSAHMGPQPFGGHQGQMYAGPGGSFGNKQYPMDGFGSHGGSGGAGGMPGGGGRGRGRGKSQKGRMPQGYGAQGGMQGDGYGAGQGFASNFDQNWMQNSRGYDGGFGKDKQGAQPPFAGGYSYDPQQYAGYGQYPPAAQFQQQPWAAQQDKFPGPKGNY